MNIDKSIAVKIKKLQEEYYVISKRVLKKDLSKNPVKLNEYKEDLIKSYNNLILNLRTIFPNAKSSNKVQLRNIFIKVRENIIRCFNALKINIKVPTNLNNIIEKQNILDTITENSINKENSDSDLETPESPNFEPLSDPETVDIEQSSEFEPENSEGSKMVLTKPEFLKICASTINRNYSGDPLALNAFCNSIDLLYELTDENADLRTFLTAFVKAKLEGKALEALPSEVPNVSSIKEALKAKILPDNSKIIEGKIQALRTSRKSLQEFSKEAEELAEAFQRSLIVEGIPQQKAQEMATERTIEMCRASARSDIVKSVIAATKFANPKEAIAKFVVETGNASKEQQILSFRSNKPNPNNNGQKFRSNNNNFNQNKPNNNFQRTNRDNRGNHDNRANRQNYGRNLNGNRNQYSQGNQNYSNNNRNNYRQNNGHRHFNMPNANNGQYDPNVRVFGPENGLSPQHLPLGEMPQMRQN